MSWSKSESSTHISDKEMGIIREAMAYKVKYRPNGEKKVVRLPIVLLGIHKMNRGGVYPAAERVKKLGIDILKWGADRDEADHNGVCVEEVPLEYRRKDPMRPDLEFESLSAFNKRKTSHPLLAGCFAGHEVMCGTLARKVSVALPQLRHCRCRYVIPSMNGNAARCSSPGSEAPVSNEKIPNYFKISHTCFSITFYAE